jgi:HEAT repeat protein
MKRKKLFLISAVLLILTQTISAFQLPGFNKENKQQNNLREKALEILQNALSSENGIARANAVEVIVNAELKPLCPILRKMTLDGAPAVRFAAAAAIADLNDPKGYNRIKALFKDNNPNVRLAAAYALTKFGDRSKAAYLQAGLKSNSDTLKANAALLIGKLHQKRYYKDLKKLLSNPHASDKVKIQVMDSIAKLGYEDIYKRLWSLLISKHPDDKVMGIRAMGSLATKEAKDAIMTMLADELWEVKLAAAEQLAKLGSKEGLPELTEYLKKNADNLHKDNVANKLAAMAIGRFNEPETNKYLPNFLKSDSMPLKLAASQSILIIEQ